MCEVVLPAHISTTAQDRTLAGVLNRREGARDSAAAVRLASLDVVAIRAGALHDSRWVRSGSLGPDGVLVQASSAFAH